MLFLYGGMGCQLSRLFSGRPCFDFFSSMFRLERGRNLGWELNYSRYRSEKKIKIMTRGLSCESPTRTSVRSTLLHILFMSHGIRINNGKFV